MKALLLSLFIVYFLSFSLHAQKSGSFIQRDTINIRGYIFYSDGKPAKREKIKSKQLDLYQNKFPLEGLTDTTGYFEIKGAKPNDTLTLAKHVFYNQPVYYNKGSRYMVIYLPAPNDQFEINESNPVIISHNRTSKRKIPSFDTSPPGGPDGDYSPEIHLPPTFIRLGDRTSYGGNELQITNQRFIDSIKSSVIYPANAIRNNIEGTVRVSFNVPSDGNPINFKILNGIGYGCEQEVISAIKKAGKWRPAIDNGKPLLASETITVEFKLTDK
jgi:TonB family protein